MQNSQIKEYWSWLVELAEITPSPNFLKHRRLSLSVLFYLFIILQLYNRVLQSERTAYTTRLQQLCLFLSFKSFASVVHLCTEYYILRLELGGVTELRMSDNCIGQINHLLHIVGQIVKRAVLHHSSCVHCKLFSYLPGQC